MNSILRFVPLALLPALVLVCAATPAEDAKYDPAGYWDVVVDMGGTPMVAGMSVKKNADGSFGGNLKSPLGDLSLAKVDYNGSEAITFGAKIGEGDKAISFKFDGKFTSKDTFEGTLVSETMGTMQVKGTRGKEPNPLAGVWDVTVDAQGGKVNRTLVVYKDGSGKYVTDADNLISDMKVEDKNVTFKTTITAGDKPLALTFKGTYAAAALNGNFDSEGNPPRALTATKSKTNIAAAAVGTWKFQAETPNGPYTADLIITSPSAGKLVATEGEAPLRKMGSDGDHFVYDVSVTYQGTKYDVSFNGTVKGDKMKGDLLMGGAPVATVECTKQAASTAPKADAPKPADKPSK